VGPHKRFAPTRKQPPAADAEVAGTADRHEALAGEVVVAAAAAAIAVEGYGLRCESSGRVRFLGSSVFCSLFLSLGLLGC